MNDSRKYEYILEPAEIREFCRKALMERIKRRLVFWILFTAILMLEACYLPPRGSITIVLLLVLVFGIISISNNMVIRRQITGQHWMIWIENGKLKSRRENYSEMPCESIQFIRITRRLLMLGYLQTPKRTAWFIVPLRVFQDAQERDAFIDRIRNPWQTFTADAPMEAEEESVQVYLRLSYMMDAERWVRLSKRAFAIIQAGTLGKRERILGMALCGGLIAVVLPVILSVIVGGFSWILVGFCFFYAAMMILRIYYRDPEKPLRKQVQAPLMVNRTCGLWQVSVAEDGITIEMPGQIKDLYVWDFLTNLVETEEVFYLFSKDKRRFIVVAKESFQTWDQVHCFRRLCEEKGIRTIPEKRMHYVPTWALVVAILLYLILCGCLVAFQFFRDHRSGEELTGTVYESSYPDYVPLDQQVMILEALGLSVDQDQVETLRDNMETYGMQEFVEGNPYTSLLIDMGAPDYDEDLRIVGYSDEVFWFDFESFDIFTGYIDVLNGMLALSKGSCLDGVTDIEEDTEKLDWERGRGTITVSVTLDDEQYQWDMKGYDDWIDSDVLGVFNTLLQQEDSQKFFYSTWDNGQGAIVFFCTEEWARGFEMATGLEMEATFTEWEKR